MSYDFALAKVCDHEVLFESLALDPYARNTLKFLRPPSSSSFVRVYMNGNEVPRGGLFSIPTFRTRTGPFRIRRGVNDILLFQHAGMNHALTLPSNTYLMPEDLVEFLQNEIPGVEFRVDDNQVVFSALPGSSFSFPDPRWSDRLEQLPNTTRALLCMKELRVVPGRNFVSKKICPGWDVITNPNSYVDDKVILFRESIPNGSPSIEVSYFTSGPDCRRCSGSGVEYDYTVQNGTFETVRNTDLLLQEFDKFLFTRTNSHWKWPWLGSSLMDRIGSKANVAGNMANTFIQMDVEQAFRNYQSVKQQQSQLQSQKVSDAEFPFSLSSLSVTSPPDDPTISFVRMGITSRSRVPVDITRVVDGIQSYSLPGDNMQFRLRG